MTQRFGGPGQTFGIGVVCAAAATVLGILYLVAAGAPLRYPVVNAAAFLLGFVALGGVAHAASRERSTGPAVVVLASCILATAVFGSSADGAERWLWLGPLSVQVSLVFLPPLMVLLARRPEGLGAAGVAIAAAGLALQPDRGMAGVLAFGMVVLAATNPGRWPAVALTAAIASLAATLLRADPLPAVPYVDRILFTAFDVHALAGAAVVAGSILLLVPALVGAYRDPAHRPVHLVFGAAWLGCVLAAALGNYPTPVVGYGGSAILGYLLSLACTPSQVRAARGRSAVESQEDHVPNHARCEIAVSPA